MLNLDDRVSQQSTDAITPLDVFPPEVHAVTMADGVRLIADVYRPKGSGPYPVLVQRQAYGRRIACSICYAHPAWYASQGYIVVIQDIRGRGASEGDFCVGEHEAEDGALTIEWASQLEGSTGVVGLYGFSYQGYNQLLAASCAGTALKAMAPAMAPWHARETWAFENGAFRLQGVLGWAVQIAAETARRNGDVESYSELLEWSRAPTYESPVQARPAFMERHRSLSHYFRWLDTPSTEDYWRKISPAAQIDAIADKNIAILLTGGWYDTHLASTLRTYEELKALSKPDLFLAIGPWLHFPWTRKVGAVDFGPQAMSDMDKIHIRFFDRYLKNKSHSFSDVEPVRLFDMGALKWRGFDELPSRRKEFYLAGDGRASVDIASGELMDNGATVQTGVDYLVHDPWRPVPSVGGAFGTPAGPVDRATIDARGDVLTFTTHPLAEAMTIAGNVIASLYVSSENISFDLACVLSRVASNGQAFPLCDGYCTTLSLEPHTHVIIPMRATCVTLQPGEALRLSVSAASFPAFPVNPGTGEDPTRANRLEAKITTLGLKYGPATPSKIVVHLPE